MACKIKRSFDYMDIVDDPNLKKNRVQDKLSSVYEENLNKIIFLLTNINSRIEKCEQNIAHILNILNNIIEEDRKKKQHDEEIYKSYIN
jgi:hypothetical protein